MKLDCFWCYILLVQGYCRLFIFRFILLSILYTLNPQIETRKSCLLYPVFIFPGVWETYWQYPVGRVRTHQALRDGGAQQPDAAQGHRFSSEFLSNNYNLKGSTVLLCIMIPSIAFFFVLLMEEDFVIDWNNICT